MISIRTNFVSLLIFLVVVPLCILHHVDATSSSGDRRPQRLLKGQKSTKSATCDNLNFSDIFVFGDSLSDQGNLASVVPLYLARSANNGKFTVEFIAEHFGLGLEMSNHIIALQMGDIEMITGNNYAVATGEAAPGPNLIFNTPVQVHAFMKKHPNGAPSDALYIVMIGGNDILALYDAKYLYDSTKTDEELFQDGELVARQLVEFTVQPLINAGAQHIVVVGVSTVGDTPFVTINQPKERSVFTGNAVVLFNNELERALKDVEDVTGTHIMFHRVAGTADFKQKGFKTETPCTIGAVGIKGSTPVIPPFNGGTDIPYIYDSECSLPDASGFAFYDEFHPTEAVHKYGAGQIIDQMCIEIDAGKDGKSSKKGKESTKSKKGKKGKESKKSEKSKKSKKSKDF